MSTITFAVGDLVTVDGEYFGEILEYLWDGFYRVEVDTERLTDSKHEFWTVHENRLSK